MKLMELMAALKENGTHENRWGSVSSGLNPDTEIGSIHYRAQAVRSGGLFVAICGHAADGHDFIETALANGAAAVLAQRAVSADRRIITVPDTRRAMGPLAARFYGRPSEKLHMTGITGTNGKTTTAYLLESVLAAAGYSVGVIGTINCRYAGHTVDTPVTTPESIDLQGMLAEMVESGVSHAIMEVSSHGIQLERIGGCRYDMAIFTNLSQDHLDFHGDLDSYWACKQRLFTQYLRPGRGMATINCNDPRGAQLAEKLQNHAATVTIGQLPACSLLPEDEIYDIRGIRARLSTGGKRFQIRSPLVGRHNLENICCAVGAAVAMGVGTDAIKAGIAALAGVPGRLERVANDRGRFVFVDYAHTPDALANALSAIRSVTGNRIICVFGCGGDRDKGKRSIMGEIAAKACDLAVITSDNPRSEDPLAIVAQVQKGAEAVDGLRRYATEALGSGFKAPGFAVEPDRRKAIELAVTASRPGDVFLIAGKGHETYQILGDRRIAFDDRKVAAQALDLVRS